MATKRKAASELTAAEQTAYHDTIGQLIQTGAYGSLVAIHGDMNHDQHGSMGPVGAERFLPWHRDFLLKLEVQLQTLNPNSFIPYWDWTQERAIPAWMGHFLPVVPVAGRKHPIHVRRSLGKHGRLPASAEINALIQHTGLSYDEFTSLLEGFHNDVHNWVGGTMGNIMISPADPIFWMHHAQVDRIWSLWQANPADAGKHPTLSGADAILDPWDPDTATAMQSITGLKYSYV